MVLLPDDIIVDQGDKVCNRNANLKNLGNMNRIGLITAGTILISTLGAAAPVVAPVLIADYFFQQTADEGRKNQSFDALLNETINKDEKFVAIIPKLTLTENWQMSNSAQIMQDEIDRSPWPQPELYRHLPGTQALIAHMKESDESDARVIANKSTAKVQALSEARGICRVIEKSTPTHIVAPDNKIELANPENLSAYLEYCGGNASTFKDALTSVVVKRGFAANAAKVDQQIKETPISK
jgi:hypothetical protein